MHLCVSIYVYVHMYLYACIYVCLYMYIYIYDWQGSAKVEMCNSYLLFLLLLLYQIIMEK